MFPLPHETFPAMKFAPDQHAAFVDCRDRLLFATMRARHEFRGACAMQLDQRMWKVLKKNKETLSVRQWRTDNVDTESDFAVYTPRRKVRVPRPLSSPTCSPILIGVGTVEGSLDDVMLGLTSTTTSAMRFTTSTMHKDVLDARVLATLKAPTEDAPFESLGFKWTVKGPPRTLRTFVRPRDFVYLASTGVRVDARGQRVGHVLMHSIELSNCPSLGSRFGIVRGALSFCYLFSESHAHPNQVDVFVRGFVDPRGSVSERVAVSAAVDTIFASQDALACAHMKKFAWKVQTDSASRITIERLDSLNVARDDAREALRTLSRTSGIGASFISDRTSERIKLEPIRRRCQSVPVVAAVPSVRRFSAVQ